MTSDLVWFLVLRASEIDLGIDAARIQRVVAPSGWGESTVDLESLLRGAPVAGSPQRVLLISGPLGVCAIGTERPLRLRACPPEELLPLPDRLWASGRPALLTGIATLPDQPPLVVLSVDALGSLLVR